jgi:hypothetical protein
MATLARVEPALAPGSRPTRTKLALAECILDIITV